MRQAQAAKGFLNVGDHDKSKVLCGYSCVARCDERNGHALVLSFLPVARREGDAPAEPYSPNERSA